MKKIDFGYNNSDHKLSSMWAGIENYNGEYLATICMDGHDYLVTRIIDSNEGLDGKIDVREVAQDYYADGSYITYADIEKSQVCKKVQELLNKVKEKEKFGNSKDVINILRDSMFSVHLSSLREIAAKNEGYSTIVTSINHSNFKKLRDSHRGHMSMYELNEIIAKMQEEIDIYKYKMGKKDSSKHY